MIAPITDKKAFVSELLERLRSRQAARGESDKQFSSRLGVSDALFKNLDSGSLPSADRLSILLKELGDSLVIGAPSARPARADLVEINGADFARIPLHEASFSAGPGIENSDTEVVGHLVFGTDWLRKVGVRPETTIMARVSGDSMAPGIQSGDLVMIDTTRKDVPVVSKSRRPSTLPIFAFSQDSEARVKRLARWPTEKLLVLYSDNHDVLPELVSESDAHVLTILGQVVWSGHVWR
jgi:phage repressor protein C with HTH and peptisase S24 domain